MTPGPTKPERPGWSIGDGGLIKPEGSADSNYTESRAPR